MLHVGKLSAEARAWHGIIEHAHDLPRSSGSAPRCGAFVGSIGANAILPARVGEALRVGVVRRNVSRGRASSRSAATIVLETAIEVAFAAVVIAVAATAGSPAAGSAGRRPCSASRRILSQSGLAVAAAALGLRSPCSTGEGTRGARRMGTGFSVVRSPRAFALQVLSWKLVAWTFRFASVYAFLLAFHVPAAPWSALAVVAAQNVAASVPLLPGNAGTQQAAIGVALAGTRRRYLAARIRRGHAGDASAAADVVIGVVAVVAHPREPRCDPPPPRSAP